MVAYKAMFTYFPFIIIYKIKIGQAIVHVKDNLICNNKIHNYSKLT